MIIVLLFVLFLALLFLSSPHKVATTEKSNHDKLVFADFSSRRYETTKWQSSVTIEISTFSLCVCSQKKICYL